MNPALIAEIVTGTAIGVGAMFAAAGLGSAIGWGLICSKTLEGIARQPEMKRPADGEHVHLRRTDGVLPVHPVWRGDVVPVREPVRERLSPSLSAPPPARGTKRSRRNRREECHGSHYRNADCPDHRFPASDLVSQGQLWGPLMSVMDARKKRIADGIAAAEQGQWELEEAEERVAEAIEEARRRATEIIDNSNRRAREIVDAARIEAEGERTRELERARTRSNSPRVRHAKACVASFARVSAAAAATHSRVRARREEARIAGGRIRGKTFQWLITQRSPGPTRAPLSSMRTRKMRSRAGRIFSVTLPSWSRLRQCAISSPVPRSGRDERAELIGEMAAEAPARGRRQPAAPDGRERPARSACPPWPRNSRVLRPRPKPRSRSRSKPRCRWKSKHPNVCVEALGKRLGRKIEANFEVVPEIIGGVVMRIGDHVMDASLATRLRRLASAMAG